MHELLRKVAGPGLIGLHGVKNMGDLPHSVRGQQGGIRTEIKTIVARWGWGINTCTTAT